MINSSEIQTYLVISKKSFKIYLYDKENSKTLFFQKLESESKINDLDLNSLDNFLNENIFKIEKLIGEFIKNIFIFLDSENIFNINISLKKKNYEQKLQLSYLENLLVEAKDLLKENHSNCKIIHMIVNRYIIDGTSYLNFISNLNADYLCLEINFKCLNNNVDLQIINILDKYHVKIDKVIDLKYINNLFLGQDIDQVQKYYRFLNGFNENEVNLIPKNNKRSGFFEKFFQFFS